jgi:hypothetical protein
MACDLAESTISAHGNDAVKHSPRTGQDSLRPPQQAHANHGCLVAAAVFVFHKW